MGCVNMVGKDQRLRHKATLPAVVHFAPKKSTMILSPPQAIKRSGSIDIKAVILTTLIVVDFISSDVWSC